MVFVAVLVFLRDWCLGVESTKHSFVPDAFERAPTKQHRHLGTGKLGTVRERPAKSPAIITQASRRLAIMPNALRILQLCLTAKKA